MWFIQCFPSIALSLPLIKNSVVYYTNTNMFQEMASAEAIARGVL